MVVRTEFYHLEKHDIRRHVCFELKDEKNTFLLPPRIYNRGTKKTPLGVVLSPATPTGPLRGVSTGLDPDYNRISPRNINVYFKHTGIENLENHHQITDIVLINLSITICITKVQKTDPLTAI